MIRITSLTDLIEIQRNFRIYININIYIYYRCSAETYLISDIPDKLNIVALTRPIIIKLNK